jgi:dUTP pyrophosphatase
MSRDRSETPIEVRFARVGTAAVPAPAYQTPDAAGLDLPAALDAVQTIAPGGRLLVPTGWSVALPSGYEGQVRPRSGLALRYGVTVLNSPGTIDADYRGEIKVLLVNLGSEPFVLGPGDRIAQLVIAPVAPVRVRVVPVLDATARGEGGYGSTGVGG